MRSLIRFILKYQNNFLFLLLELVSLLLVINKNSYHNAKFYTWSLSTMGTVYEKQTELTDFFSLKATNEQLAQENAALKELLIKGSAASSTAFLSISDPLSEKNIDIIPAKVVNSSVSNQYNLFTLNVGKADSVGIDMAVVSPLGIVGVVVSVSKHYAMVMPMVNVDYRVSSKLKNSDYFGTLKWNGQDYRYAYLEGIEQHVDVSQGDTVITSGYGATFPEGIMVGTVESVSPGEEGVFHVVQVRMATDYKRMSYVYVIKNNDREERIALEEERK